MVAWHPGRGRSERGEVLEVGHDVGAAAKANTAILVGIRVLWDCDMRFSVRNLLTAVFLACLILTLVQSEGCGYRYSKVTGIAFSPCSTELVVARFDGRDAQVRFKAYLTNVCRTVSQLDAETGATRRLFEQDLRRGNKGPAFRFRNPKTDLLFAGDGTLVLSEFGGGSVRFYDRRSGDLSAELTPPPAAITLALNRDRTILSAGGAETISWDLRTGSVLPTANTIADPLTDSPLLAYSKTTDLLIAVGPTGIERWDVTTGTSVERVDLPPGVTSAVAVSPDGERLIVARHQRVELFDITDEIQLLKRLPVTSEVSFLPDGNSVALADESGAVIVDITGAQAPRELETSEYVTALAVSPDGHRIAVGDHDGQVMVFDANTGSKLWQRSAPGYYRPPWTLPAAVGAVYVAFWCVRNRKRLLSSTAGSGGFGGAIHTSDHESERVTQIGPQRGHARMQTTKGE